jgi:hypothetical protein
LGKERDEEKDGNDDSAQQGRPAVAKDIGRPRPEAARLPAAERFRTLFSWL